MTNHDKKAFTALYIAFTAILSDLKTFKHKSLDMQLKWMYTKYLELLDQYSTKDERVAIKNKVDSRVLPEVHILTKGMIDSHPDLVGLYIIYVYFCENTKTPDKFEYFKDGDKIMKAIENAITEDMSDDVAYDLAYKIKERCL